LWGELALVAAARTVAVKREVTELDPAAFDAVTVTSSSLPRSAPTTVYDLEVAPAIALHLSPCPLQRRHWYLKRVGDPVHDPLAAVSLWCTRILPKIPGRPVMRGVVGSVDEGAPGGPVASEDRGTVAVAADVAERDPPPFDAVTVTASVWPTSTLATL
jgi:hypothetical protein